MKTVITTAPVKVKSLSATPPKHGKRDIDATKTQLKAARAYHASMQAEKAGGGLSAGYKKILNESIRITAAEITKLKAFLDVNGQEDPGSF